jgi:hypothetical protein
MEDNTMKYAQPHVNWETQSILGLMKPCLEKAAAGRLWAEEGQEKGWCFCFFPFSCFHFYFRGVTTDCQERMH